MIKKYLFKLFIFTISIFIIACTSSISGEKVLLLLNGDKKDKQQVEVIISEVYFKTFNKNCKEECSKAILNEVVLNYLIKFNNKRNQDGRELIQRAIEDDNGDLYRNKKAEQEEQGRIIREAFKNINEKQELPFKSIGD
jgi:hypothetical protein